MTGPGLSPLTDLAANLACLFLLLLVILLAEPARRPAAEAAGPVQIRAPLDAGAMVAQLHARSRAGTGWRVDLFASRLRIIDPQGRETLLAGPVAQWPAALRGLGATGPIRVYVGAQEGYAAVLAAFGPERVQDLSLPAALLHHAEGRAEDWSPGFRALLETRLDSASFTRRLADLLEAGPRGRTRNPAGTPEQAAFAAGSPLARAFRIALFWLALLAGLGFMLWVETRPDQET